MSKFVEITSSRRSIGFEQAQDDVFYIKPHKKRSVLLLSEKCYNTVNRCKEGGGQIWPSKLRPAFRTVL